MDPCSHLASLLVLENESVPVCPYLFGEPSSFLGILPTPSVTPSAIPQDMPQEHSLSSRTYIHKKVSTLNTSVQRSVQIDNIFSQYPFTGTSSLLDCSFPEAYSSTTLLLPTLERLHRGARLVSQVMARKAYRGQQHHWTSSRSHQNQHIKHSSAESSEGYQYLNRSDRNVPKQRRRLSRDETEYLLGRFQEQKRPTAKDRVKIAEKLHLHPKTVQIWFQNRRAKLRKDESIARNPCIGRKVEDDQEDIVKDSVGHLGGTDLVGSYSSSTENHHCGSGTETFIGFVGSPLSEDFKCDPVWAELAEGKGRSVEETKHGVTITKEPSTFCDRIYKPSLLEEPSTDLHLELGMDNFCCDDPGDLTDLAGLPIPAGLEYEGNDLTASKNESSRPTPARPTNVNSHVPRHQMGLTLVPKDLLSTYVRAVATSRDL